MVSLFDYIVEALSLDQVRDYLNIKRDPKAQIYMNAFWQTLQEYVLSHGGKESHNKYRLYLPYTGPNPEVAADDSEKSGSHSFWTDMRHYIKYLVETDLEEYGYQIDKWNYIEGTCEASLIDPNKPAKTRSYKIGRLISGEIDPRTNKSVLDFYNNDPIRLGKNITNAIKNKNLCLAISNHAYDIAGMSTNRDWTSCMNILNGESKEYVAADIEFGTMIAYIIDSKDTNIEHPYGRILIKPYKLSRKGYRGKDAAPVVYAPEVTVYSPYIGLKPIREWLKDICEEIQEGEGMLKNFKQLYSDSYHDRVDREFKGRK